MKYYKIFGYIVKSSFSIDEAMEVEAKEYDIFVEMGMPPLAVKEVLETGVTCSVDRQIAWFYMKGIGMYYIAHGNHILVWKEGEGMTELIRNYHLLGSAFSLLLFQREVFPMHSGAVEKDGKAVLLLGGSGAGKSTTNMILRQQGGNFIADDITPLQLKNGKVMVSPAFPVQRVCKDTALRQKLDFDRLTYINPEKDKYAMFLQEGYCKEDIPLAMIVELGLTYADAIEVRKVDGIEKINLLYHNVFQGLMLDVMGITERMHQSIFKIAQKVPVYQIIRPINGFYSEIIAQKILTMLQSC